MGVRALNDASVAVIGKALHHERALTDALAQLGRQVGASCARSYARMATPVAPHVALVAAGPQQPQQPQQPAQPGAPVTPDQLLHAADITHYWIHQVEPLLGDAAKEFVTALSRTGVSTELLGAGVAASAASMSVRAQQQFEQWLTDQVGSALTTGALEGESVPDVAKRIRAAVVDQSDWRAKTIARTMLVGTGNAGSLRTAMLLGEGRPKYKRWLSAEDERVRPTHVEADGQVVPIDSPFHVGDDELMFPGDPQGSDEETINCRCVQVYTDDPSPQGLVRASAFLEDEHPRFPAGDSRGGQFAPKGEAFSGAPIDVHGNVELALNLLGQGKRVELHQPMEVSTLLDKLGDRVQQLAAEGKEAPNFNLCGVTLRGTSVFCGENVGLARVDMPQLRGVPLPGSPASAIVDARGKSDLKPGFLKMLQGEGVKTRDVTVGAGYLKASQRELNGAKVAGLYDYLGAGNKMPGRIVVNNEGYVLDGHHNWAAAVGVAARDGDLYNDMPVDATMVDLPILELVDRAKRYANEQGIPGKGFSASGFDESEHPRHPQGTPEGGEFAPKGLGDLAASMPSKPKPHFATDTDANAWFRERGIETTFNNLTAFERSQVEEMAQHYDYIQSRWPQVRPENGGLKRLLMSDDPRLQADPNFDYEQYGSAMVTFQDEALDNGFKWDQIDYTKPGTSAVVVNRPYLENLPGDIMMAAEGGMATQSVGQVMAHELGHVVMNNTPGGREAMYDAYMGAIGDTQNDMLKAIGEEPLPTPWTGRILAPGAALIGRGISPYGLSNPAEGYAEHFVRRNYADSRARIPKMLLPYTDEVASRYNQRMGGRYL